MAIGLTFSGESRLDGAPGQDLPSYADLVEKYAVYLVSQDKEGALYGGDPANARQDAIAYVKQMEAAKQAQAAQRRAAGQAAVMAADAERDQMRASRQGVVPESLPMDEYGNVSARTVRDANMPLADQEAALAQYQALVDAETRDLREGRFHGAAAQARQYEQDYGLPTTPSSTGKTDLDYLREQQAHQGFLRTGSGEMIPMGPAPTPESLASRRGFDEWANETPGTERQALYDPQSYAQFREGVRDEIRSRAQEEMVKFGGADPSQWTDEQKAARDARRAAEQASRNDPRTAAMRRMRMEEAAGLSPEEAAGMTELDLSVAAERRRMQDRSARRDRATLQARLAGGQPTARSRSQVEGVMFQRGRVDELIGRLGQDGMNDWQRAGIIASLSPNAQTANPTPLGVDAVGGQNALRFINNEAMAGMDPLRREAALAQMEQQMAALPPEQKVAVSIARREPMGTGLSTGPVNSAWNNAYTRKGFREQMEGWGYQPAEIDAWIDARLNGPEEGPPAARQAPLPAPPAPPARATVPSQPPVTGRPAPPPGAYRWRGNRGTQIPPQSPTSRR